MEMVVKKFLCRLITTLQGLQSKDILLATEADLDRPGRLEEAQYHLEKTHFQIRYKMRSGTVEYIYKIFTPYLIKRLTPILIIFRLETTYFIFHPRLEV